MIYDIVLWIGVAACVAWIWSDALYDHFEEFIRWFDENKHG